VLGHKQQLSSCLLPCLVLPSPDVSATFFCFVAVFVTLSECVEPRGGVTVKASLTCCLLAVVQGAVVLVSWPFGCN
jgi:hypothetical protein